MSAVKKQNPAAEKESENFHVAPKQSADKAQPTSDAATSDVVSRDADAGAIVTDASGQINQPLRDTNTDRSQVS